MKQKDIALIAVVVVASAVVSFVVSRLLFATPHDRQQKVEVVTPITADFPIPDDKYFNEKSVDPTKLIQIGVNSNPSPFNSNQGQ